MKCGATVGRCEGDSWWITNEDAADVVMYLGWCAWIRAPDLIDIPAIAASIFWALSPWNQAIPILGYNFTFYFHLYT
jgi:hypothetical protein